MIGGVCVGGLPRKMFYYYQHHSTWLHLIVAAGIVRSGFSPFSDSSYMPNYELSQELAPWSYASYQVPELNDFASWAGSEEISSIYAPEWGLTSRFTNEHTRASLSPSPGGNRVSQPSCGSTQFGETRNFGVEGSLPKYHKPVRLAVDLSQNHQSTFNSSANFVVNTNGVRGRSSNGGCGVGYESGQLPLHQNRSGVSDSRAICLSSRYYCLYGDRVGTWIRSFNQFDTSLHVPANRPPLTDIWGDFESIGALERPSVTSRSTNEGFHSEQENETEDSRILFNNIANNSSSWPRVSDGSSRGSALSMSASNAAFRSWQYEDFNHTPRHFEPAQRNDVDGNAFNETHLFRENQLEFERNLLVSKRSNVWQIFRNGNFQEQPGPRSHRIPSVATQSEAATLNESFSLSNQAIDTPASVAATSELDSALFDAGSASDNFELLVRQLCLLLYGDDSRSLNRHSNNSGQWAADTDVGSSYAMCLDLLLVRQPTETVIDGHGATDAVDVVDSSGDTRRRTPSFAVREFRGERLAYLARSAGPQQQQLIAYLSEDKCTDATTGGEAATGAVGGANTAAGGAAVDDVRVNNGDALLSPENAELISSLWKYDADLLADLDFITASSVEAGSFGHFLRSHHHHQQQQQLGSLLQSSPPPPPPPAWQALARHDALSDSLKAITPVAGVRPSTRAAEFSPLHAASSPPSPSYKAEHETNMQEAFIGPFEFNDGDLDFESLPGPSSLPQMSNYTWDNWCADYLCNPLAPPSEWDLPCSDDWLDAACLTLDTTTAPGSAVSMNGSEPSGDPLGSVLVNNASLPAATADADQEDLDAVACRLAALPEAAAAVNYSTQSVQYSPAEQVTATQAAPAAAATTSGNTDDVGTSEIWYSPTPDGVEPLLAPSVSADVDQRLFRNLFSHNGFSSQLAEITDSFDDFTETFSDAGQPMQTCSVETQQSLSDSLVSPDHRELTATRRMTSCDETQSRECRSTASRSAVQADKGGFSRSNRTSASDRCFDKRLSLSSNANCVSADAFLETMDSSSQSLSLTSAAANAYENGISFFSQHHEDSLQGDSEAPIDDLRRPPSNQTSWSGEAVLFCRSSSSKTSSNASASSWNDDFNNLTTINKNFQRNDLEGQEGERREEDILLIKTPVEEAFGLCTDLTKEDLEAAEVLQALQHNHSYASLSKSTTVSRRQKPLLLSSCFNWNQKTSVGGFAANLSDNPQSQRLSTCASFAERSSTANNNLDDAQRCLSPYPVSLITPSEESVQPFPKLEPFDQADDETLQESGAFDGQHTCSLILKSCRGDDTDSGPGGCSQDTSNGSTFDGNDSPTLVGGCRRKIAGVYVGRGLINESADSHASHEDDHSLDGSLANEDISDSLAYNMGTLSRDERRARELALPISAEEIVSLSKAEITDRLSRYDLTDDQRCLIRDIRRRGKNKVAAQNCRKRKLDQIDELQKKVDNMRAFRESLLERRDKLSRQAASATERYNQLLELIRAVPVSSTSDERVSPSSLRRWQQVLRQHLDSICLETRQKEKLQHDRE